MKNRGGNSIVVSGSEWEIYRGSGSDWEIYRWSGSEWEIYRGSVRIMKSKINNILLLSVLFRNSLFLDKESSIEKQEKSKKNKEKKL